MKPTEWIGRDGAVVLWADARVHASTSALHHGMPLLPAVEGLMTACKDVVRQHELPRPRQTAFYGRCAGGTQDRRGRLEPVDA